jgi:hypothetical protein
VADLDHFDGAPFIVHSVDDAVIPLANSVAILPGEFLVSWRTRIVG